MKKIRIILCLLLAAVLPAGLFPAPASAAEIGSMKDVSDTMWFYPAVEYCLAEGLMRGVSDDAFSPGAKVTRAQVVQVLYNMAGSPAIEEGDGGYEPFRDVPSEKWYAPAVYWARANEIVYGVTAVEFRPEDTATREQTASMLYRYAVYSGRIGASVIPEPVYLMPYEDREQISIYALISMNWAVQHGVMRGNSSTTLNPQGTCIRAELAQMTRNYFQPQPVIRPVIPEEELTITPIYTTGRGDLAAGCFTVHLPESWAGAYVVENEETDTTYGLSFYEKGSREQGFGGWLFTLTSFPQDTDYTLYPSYHLVGTLEQPGGWQELLVAIFPTDVQFSPEQEAVYSRMAGEIADVLAELTYASDCVFVPGPDPEVHPM